MKSVENPLIFIVDDNKLYTKVIVTFLKTHKFTNVETFTSGEDVLKELKRKPDIMILDYLLGGIDGLEVLKKAKEIAPEVDVIFLSGQENINVVVDAVNHGADYYLVKNNPETMNNLIRRLDKILTVHKVSATHKRFKTGVTFFFILLVVFIIVIILIAQKVGFSYN